MNENSVAVSIVLVGCGAPLKSMGWYHAIQLLAFEDLNGRLEYIVEPWFMSEVGKASPGGAEFHAFKGELESTTDILFFSHYTFGAASKTSGLALGKLTGKGQKLLILGGSTSVGQYAIQLAKNATDAKRKFAVFCGADATDPPFGRVPMEVEVILQDIDVGTEGNRMMMTIGARQKRFLPAQLLNEPNTKRLAIISARTADNPRLFASCLENLGCHAIFLEKPGASSVLELELMQTKARESGVTVYMGFNKNVSKYVTKTRAYAKNHLGNNVVTFLHNNNYDESDLDECFERNSEGILKNMAIHEIAIAVSFHGVTADNILTVVADEDFSKCLTLQGPSGQMYTDFSKLKFTILTKYGDTVSIAADRCGGDDSVGIVANHEGNELVRFTMPDDEDAAFIKNAETQMPGAMPYFYVQSPDYLTLKQRVINAIASSTTADGVATIDTAVESLKVAEYLTPVLMEQLK